MQKKYRKWFIVSKATSQEEQVQPT